MDRRRRAAAAASCDASPSGIGRASDNQLVLKDFSVSRHHARLEQRGDTWWVVDLGSTNGVKVNGRYVTDAMLTEGDQVQVGNFTLSYHRGESSAGLSVSSSTFLRTPRGVPRGLPPRARAGQDRAQSTAATARERVLEALAQVARTLLEVEELEPVLDKVMEAVFEQLPAERAYILLFTPEGQAELRIARSRGGARAGRGAGLADHPRPGEPPEGRRADLRRPVRRALRGRAVRAPAPDPLGDVRAAVAPRQR